jgi:hypothetical protein
MYSCSCASFNSTIEESFVFFARKSVISIHPTEDYDEKSEMAYPWPLPQPSPYPPPFYSPSADEQYDAFDALFDPERSGIEYTNEIMYGESVNDESTSTMHPQPSDPTNGQHISREQQQSEAEEETQQNSGRAYFVDRGVFSENQKATIQLHCSEAASSVLDRLREQDPAMTQTYRQVKGAVENERRKQHRREDNGSWTIEERDIVSQNLAMKPKDLTTLLRSTIQGFRKNIDQVRDMKNQMAATKNGKATTTTNTEQ